MGGGGGGGGGVYPQNAGILVLNFFYKHVVGELLNIALYFKL